GHRGAYQAEHGLCRTGEREGARPLAPRRRARSATRPAPGPPQPRRGSRARRGHRAGHRATRRGGAAMNTMLLSQSTDLAQRRALARVHPAAPRLEETEDNAGLVTRTLAFAIDALVVNAVALITGVVVGLCLSILHLPSNVVTVLAAIGGGVWI